MSTLKSLSAVIQNVALVFCLVRGQYNIPFKRIASIALSRHVCRAFFEKVQLLHLGFCIIGDVWEDHEQDTTSLLHLCRVLEQGAMPFVETVPFRVIAAFTLLQFLGLAVVYVVSTWTAVCVCILTCLVLCCFCTQRSAALWLVNYACLWLYSLCSYQTVTTGSHKWLFTFLSYVGAFAYVRSISWRGVLGVQLYHCLDPGRAFVCNKTNQQPVWWHKAWTKLFYQSADCTKTLVGFWHALHRNRALYGRVNGNNSDSLH